MSSILTPQGMAFATAMAVSGTVILLAYRLQKPVDDHVSRPALRSCILSDGKRREKNKKKRVHFAADVVDPSGYSEEFRRRRGGIAANSAPPSPSPNPTKFKKNASNKASGMPANRMALYSGILRDRVVHRLAYSC